MKWKFKKQLTIKVEKAKNGGLKGTLKLEIYYVELYVLGSKWVLTKTSIVVSNLSTGTS